MRITASLLLGVLLLVSCDATGPDDGGSPPVGQPMVPTGLSLLNSFDQIAEAGTRLTLSVRAVTERGAAVAGVVVLWEVADGVGSISPASSQTGTNGVASAEVLVGMGVNRVTARVQGKDITASYSVQGCGTCGAWDVVSAPQEARAWATTVVVGSDVWLIGGEAWPGSRELVTVFMTANRSWGRNVVSLPHATMASVALVLGSRIYVIGGNPSDLYYFIRGERTVYSHDPGSSVWNDRAPLTVGRFFAAGAALEGKLYILGGHTYCYYWGWCLDGALSSMEVYDPAGDRWVVGPPMKFRRSMAGAAALDGKLYVAGGVNDDNFWKGAFVYSMEMFDPGTQMWVARKDMPVGGPTQLVAMNGKLYALQTGQMDGYASRVDVYDPAADTWSRLRDVPASLLGPSAAVVDGRMYVIGGYASASDRPYVRPLSQAVYVLRH